MERLSQIKCFMETLTFSYAKRIQDRLPVVAREHCYGCEINHPSQIQHTCLMCTDLEHLELYFDDAYERISMAEVLKTIKPKILFGMILSILLNLKQKGKCMKCCARTLTIVKRTSLKNQMCINL